MPDQRGAAGANRLTGGAAPGPDHDPDGTIKVRRKASWRRHLPIAGAVVLVLGTAGGAYNVWRSTPAPLPASTAVAAVPPVAGLAPIASVAPPISRAAVVAVPEAPAIGAVRPPVAPPQTFDIRLASESEILADQPAGMAVFRFRSNQAIVVLDFASLAEQGQMLNRMAVFEEKDGYPHDRLLSDGELDAAIRNGGDEPATFYYGHDYRAEAVARFFAIADRDKVALTAQEQLLRGLMTQLGWEAPGAVGALITLPRLAADTTIDAQARATILRHELSHGEYFTNPAYAAFTRHFWRDLMTDADRAGFRKFLIADHYDGGIEDLMMNEGQAYLMHTHDARFFTAQFVGLSAERVEELRQMFMAGMPHGWLRDATLPPRPVMTPAAAVTRRAPRRRVGRAGRRFAVT